jgi:hypothetical protein
MLVISGRDKRSWRLNSAKTGPVRYRRRIIVEQMRIKILNAFDFTGMDMQ